LEVNTEKPAVTIHSPAGLFLPAAGKPAQPHTPSRCIACSIKIFYAIHRNNVKGKELRAFCFVSLTFEITSNRPRLAIGGLALAFPSRISTC